MSEKTVCELPKNAREVIHFRLAEFKGHQFIDFRIYTKENGKNPAPTKKCLAVSPQLWPQFRVALAQVEAAIIKEGWLDKEDLALEGIT
jgi:hypothetical protein